MSVKKSLKKLATWGASLYGPVAFNTAHELGHCIPLSAAGKIPIIYSEEIIKGIPLYLPVAVSVNGQVSPLLYLATTIAGPLVEFSSQFGCSYLSRRIDREKMPNLKSILYGSSFFGTSLTMMYSVLRSLENRGDFSMLAYGFGIQVPFTLSIWLAAEAFTIIYGARGYGHDNFRDNIREFARDFVGLGTIKRIRKCEDYLKRKLKIQ